MKAKNKTDNTINSYKNLRRIILFKIFILFIFFIGIFILTLFSHVYLEENNKSNINREELLKEIESLYENTSEEIKNEIEKLFYRDVNKSVINNEILIISEYKVNSNLIQNLENIFSPNNGIFYFLKQQNGKTYFFYKLDLGYKFENGRIILFYTPKNIFQINRYIDNITELNDIEKEKLLLKIKSYQDSINNNLYIYGDNLNNELKKLLELDSFSFFDTSISKKFQQLILNEEKIIENFKPDLSFNMFYIFKIFITGFLSFIMISIFLVIKNLIDNYNKTDILLAISNNVVDTSEENRRANGEIINMVNQFYKNNKDSDNKDLILEIIKNYKISDKH
ncbi:hypothetical protein ACOL3D_04825 [Aliarcobacter butzleri]